MIRNSISFLAFFTLWPSFLLWSQNTSMFHCYNLDSIAWTLKLPDCDNPQIDSFQILVRNQPNDGFVHHYTGFNSGTRGYRDEVLKSADAIILRYFLLCPYSSSISDTLDLSALRESVQIRSLRVLDNGNVEIIWKEKPIQDIRYVVNAAVGGSSVVLATDLREGKYIDTRGLASHNIEYFSISAVLDCGYTLPEPDSFFHTSYLTWDVNSCNSFIQFNFQPFSYWSSGTASSKLMVMQDNHLVDSVELVVGETQFTYENVDINENYTFFVRENGGENPLQVAYSNSVEINTDFYPSIRWITITDLSFDEHNQASMTWRTNEHNPINDFEVTDLHTTAPIPASSLNVLTQGQQYQLPLQIDPQSYYQITIQDSCENEVSSLEKKPLLTQGLLTSGNEIHVQWTDVADTEWLISHYDIYGIVNGQSLLLGSADDRSFSFSHTFEPGASLDSLCYYVVAKGEVNLPEENESLEVRSNTVCLYGETIVEIPNAHSSHQPPYKPIIVPRSNLTSYVFRIFDRYGSLVFETTDPEKGWSGLYQNNSGFMDVFVVQVEITNNQGESIEKTGSLILFP